MTAELDALNRRAIEAAQLQMGHFAWGMLTLQVGVAIAYVVNLGLGAAGMADHLGAADID